MTTVVRIVITCIVLVMAILFLIFVGFSLYTEIRDDVRKEKERKAAEIGNKM